MNDSFETEYTDESRFPEPDQLDLQTCLEAGEAYQHDQQYTQAIPYLKRCAEDPQLAEIADPAEVWCDLGSCCQKASEDGEDTDLLAHATEAYRHALDLYAEKAASEEDHGAADYSMGRILHEKCPGVHDDPQAFQHFERSHLRGHGGGTWMLAQCYEYGWGVPRDPARAFSITQEFRERIPALLLQLGLYYEYGIGVKADPAAAVRIYQNVLNSENADYFGGAAAFLLGCCYYHGCGVAADHQKALELFQTSDLPLEWPYSRAIQEPSASNLNILALLYGKGWSWLVKSCPERRFHLLEQACALPDGSKYANQLAEYFLQGTCTRRDPRRAFQLYSQAEGTESRYFTRQITGEMYYYGCGTARNYLEAVRCFDAGARQGFERALLYLGLCYWNGTGVTANPEHALDVLGTIPADCKDAYGRCAALLRCLYALARPELAWAPEADIQQQLKAAITAANEMWPIWDFINCYFSAPCPKQAQYCIRFLEMVLSRRYWIDSRALSFCKLCYGIFCIAFPSAILLLCHGKKLSEIDQLKKELAAVTRQLTLSQAELSSRDDTITELSDEVRRYRQELADRYSMIQLAEQMRSGQAETQEALRRMSGQLSGLCSTAAGIDDTTKQMKAQLDSLMQFVQTDLQDWLSQEKQRMEAAEASGDEQSVQALLRNSADYINQKVLASQDSVQQERSQLQALFGPVWDRLAPNTQSSLISAGVLWNCCSGITDDSFDYSGICICATSALEMELDQVFFTGFRKYMLETYGDPNEVLLADQVYSIWPEILLGKTKAEYRQEALQGNAVVLRLRNYFELGDLPFLFASKNQEQNDVLQPRMTEYLRTIVKAPYQDDPITAINGSTQLLKKKQRPPYGFVGDCEYVRIHYRNPAAHTNLISRETAKSCYEKTITGRSDCYRCTSDVKGLIMQLYDFLQ